MYHQHALLDQKIAELENEFYSLMTVSPPDVSRSSAIVSELGRLWNAKLRDEEPRGDMVTDWGWIQEAVAEVVASGRRKMGQARSRHELQQTFVQSIRQMIFLLEE